MKRFGYIFDEMISVDNLRKAHFEAKMSHRPSRRRGALKFERNLEANLLRLHADLASGTWRMHPYSSMIRIERGKRREIFYSSHHVDSVVQHAILRTLGRKIERTFIRDTYASIPGRGTDDGIFRLKRYIRSIPSGVPVYVWKIDLRKFYQSIQHEPLYFALESAIKDSRALRLLASIVASHTPGIPIGNALSPLFANLLMSDFDHAVKEKWRIRGYFRYLDDVVVILPGNDAKTRLKALSAWAHDYLAGIGLSIKPNEQIFPIERGGVDFLGYVIGRTAMLLRRKTERRFRRAIRRFRFNPTKHNLMTLSSYWGMLKRMPCGVRFWFTFFSKPIYQLEVSL